MRLVEAGLEPDQILGMVGWKEQLLLQARVPVREFGFSRTLEAQTESAVRWLGEDPQRRALLLPAAAPSECIHWNRGRELIFAHGRHWVMIDADAIDADCLRP